MKYYTIAPPPELTPYVRFFWVLESEASGESPYVHRSMASGCCELLFHYKGKFDELLPDGSKLSSIYSGIAGPSQKFSRFYICEDFGIFGIYMYPFAMTALFGLPASEIANEMPDLSTLFGQIGKDLENQIMLAPDNSMRTAILTKYLLSKIKQRKIYEPAVFSSIVHIIRSRGNVTVDKLADQCYLSTRQFERNFKAHAGFSPKLYCRIIRFQSATMEYTNQRRSLTEIAYECGYYDQSHFIHDFKEFSGYHPKHYFSGNNEGTTWKDS